MVSFISHMHQTLIKDIGCVIGVIEFLCQKTSAAVNDVKAQSFGITSYGLCVLHFNRESDN